MQNAFVRCRLAMSVILASIAHPGSSLEYGNRPLSCVRGEGRSLGIDIAWAGFQAESH